MDLEKGVHKKWQYHVLEHLILERTIDALTMRKSLKMWRNAKTVVVRVSRTNSACTVAITLDAL